MSVETTRTALIEQGHWLTVPDCKRVLVVVHTVAFAQRLREVFGLLETDLRIQLVFTVAPHAFGGGVTDYLRGQGIATVPWKEALRAEFDLVLATGSRGLHRLRAPVVRFSHGAGHIKLLTDVSLLAPGERRVPGMLSRQHLLHDGRVVPSSLVYAHQRDVTELARSCPEALPAAHVAGDPCVDRIEAGAAGREGYRRALGIEEGQRLVVVASTWGPASTFGRLDALLPQLLGQLPDEGCRVAMLIHPNVFAGHGRSQVHGWLTALRSRGIAVVPPEADWQALLIAADWIIGDHGSLTAYGTLTEATVLLTSSVRREVSPDSPAALLAAVAPVVVPGHSLAAQLAYASERRHATLYARVAESLSSAPGEFHRRVRALLYRSLELGEPACPPFVPPPAVPPSLEHWVGGADRGAFR
ncbi:hypothetical protein ACSMX9_12665 [Streptomyces sp. LE64]|uniref:hypothetical protein n=1 Tax=Streptomyces sp. LE64 TaxID=3448653 RepID=UPI004042AB74